MKTKKTNKRRILARKQARFYDKKAGWLQVYVFEDGRVGILSGFKDMDTGAVLFTKARVRQLLEFLSDAV